MMQSLHVIDWFSAHAAAFLALHILGVALGMGGATIADMLFFNFLRDFKISKKEASVLHLLSHVILAALGILLLSGIALFLSDPVRFSSSAAFLSKAVILCILSVNGILMHYWIAPHMVHFSFLHHPLSARRNMHHLRAVSFGMGAISFTSWYSVFLIASLKSYFPEDVQMSMILGTYFAILAVAILSSQLLHGRLCKHSAWLQEQHSA